MTDHLPALQLRLVLLVGLFVISIIQSGLLLYFWKKISLWQRVYALSFILLQIYVIDVLRASITTDLGLRWRLIPLTVSVLLLAANALVPFSRRKRDNEDLNTNVFIEKTKD